MLHATGIWKDAYRKRRHPEQHHYSVPRVTKVDNNLAVLQK